MNSDKVVGICLIALVCIAIYYAIWGLRKHCFIFAMKMVINNFRLLFHLIWAIFILVIGVQLIPFLEERFSGMESAITRFLPTAWVLFLLAMVWWITSHGYRPLIPYTEKEKVTMKESDDRFVAKLPKWMQKMHWNKEA